jgi:peptide/nickel transport system substrate-binding protein
MAGLSRIRRPGLNRRGFIAASGAAGAAAFVAACGGGDDDAPSGGQPSSGGQTGGAVPAGTQAAVQQKPTGQVTVVQGVDANTLDPSFRNATPEFNIMLHVFDTLLNRDAKTLKPVPALAQEFKNVDPTTWEFKLRSNATFHDGTKVDAEAIKFSLDRTSKESIGGKPTVPRIRRTMSYDSVQVVDATTFRIKTSTPSPVLPDILTSVEIVAPSAYATDAEVQSKAVGSGGWKLVEWQKDQRLVLEANPNWWGGNVPFERVIFRPVAETSTRILQLTNGEADVIVNVPPDNASQVERSDKARISKVDGLRKIFVGIRTEKQPALADKRVRQAMNHALNWDAISRALLDGSGKRMKTYFNPPHEPADAKAYDFNVNRAKELLSQAGYPNGLTVTMNAPTGRYIKDKDIAQAVAQNLEAVGIKVNLNILEWSVYAGQQLTKANGGPPSDLYFVGLGAPVNGQDEAFFFHPDYQLNFTDWKNAEYLALFDKLKVELDEKKFQDHVNQIHKILWDEVPWIGIWNQVDFYGASKKLTWEARPDERISMYEASWKS